MIEIGPGLGNLTSELAKNVGHLIAIEKDQTLRPHLEKNLSPFSNIELIFQDALKYKLPEIPYKVVANIPYYLTSPLLRKFLKNCSINSLKPPSLLILMIQKEVAQKICAKPPKMSILSLNVQTFAQTKIIHKISKNNFFPRPKIDSALIKIVPYPDPLIKCDMHTYFHLIEIAFSQKRKRLANSLKHGINMTTQKLNQLLSEANIDGWRRPETLEIKEWEKLVILYSRLNLKHLNTS